MPIAARELARRWLNVDRQLWDLLNGRTQPGDVDPATREAELTAELRRLGWQLVGIQLNQQTAENASAAFDGRMSELASSFPTLRDGVPGVRPWDQYQLDHWAASSGAVTHGSLLAARAVLYIWNPSVEWESGRFDLAEAFQVWDVFHREAFLQWAEDPWFP